MKFPRRFIFGLIAVMLAAACARSQVTVQIGQNFTGSTYGAETQAIPPDANGFVGPQHFVEFINGTVAVYSKATGLSVKRNSNLSFWAHAGLVLSSDTDVTDPRVIYDPSVQRWFAVQVDFDSMAADPTSEANDFLFAVSATADPTGTWQGFQFQADPDNGDFADFPTLGVDSNAVYLAGDMHRVMSGNDVSVGSGLVSFPKADLLAATPTISNRTWFGVMNYNVRGQVLRPAICLDGSSTGSVVATISAGDNSTPYSNLVCFSVLNGATTNATLTAPTNLVVTPYEIPYSSDLGMPWFLVSQPDGTTDLSGNDLRFSANVYAVSGVMYAVHSTEFNGQMAVRWYRINATNHALLESGTIAEPAMDLFFPAIAANANGTVVIVCNGAGLGTNVNCYAYGGQTVNGTTSFGSAVLLQSGQTSYHGDDETIDEFEGMPVFSRWGDYSAVSVDAGNPSHFWSITMFPSDGASADVYSTQITELVVAPPPPVLAISLPGTNALISWSATATGFQLQTSPSPTSAPSWTNVVQTPVTNGSLIKVTVPRSANTQYFRLIQ